MSGVEVTSGTAVEIRFTLCDCYFESNSSEKGGDVLAACCAKHTHPPTSQIHDNGKTPAGRTQVLQARAQPIEKRQMPLLCHLYTLKIEYPYVNIFILTPSVIYIKKQQQKQCDYLSPRDVFPFCQPEEAFSLERNKRQMTSPVPFPSICLYESIWQRLKALMLLWSKYKVSMVLNIQCSWARPIASTGPDGFLSFRTP